MITISIKKQDNRRRGEVTRILELNDDVRVQDWLGALEGLLRQCFPDQMQRRSLTLPNTTGMLDEAITERDYIRAGLPDVTNIVSSAGSSSTGNSLYGGAIPTFTGVGEAQAVDNAILTENNSTAQEYYSQRWHVQEVAPTRISENRRYISRPSINLQQVPTSPRRGQ